MLFPFVVEFEAFKAEALEIPELTKMTQASIGDLGAVDIEVS
jgi:hypothetical protein